VPAFEYDIHKRVLSVAALAAKHFDVTLARKIS